jgi:hypothetical protein
MTVKTGDAARRRTAAWASGGGAARAGTGEQLSRADRVARGKDARAMAPLESHAEFTPDASRPRRAPDRRERRQSPGDH